jgi:biotin operon repressor
MNENNQQQLKPYSSSRDVATLLEIKESTLRKYALMLEDAGYKFHKNEYGHRMYFESDVIVLRKLLDIKSHPDMTLKQSTEKIVERVEDSDLSGSDRDDNMAIYGRYNELYKELRDFKERQEKSYQSLFERLEKRDQKLMRILYDILGKFREL